MKRRVDFYLRPSKLAQMTNGGGHRFFNRAKTAFESVGLEVRLREDTLLARHAAILDPAYALFDYQEPLTDFTLDVRRTAIGPFYRMEQSAARGEYRLVSRRFVPEDVPDQKANSFFKIWQRLLVKQGEMLPKGAVLVVLQGKLLRHRSQQSMSPVDMIRTTIEHEPSRDIWLKLHPKETYSDGELAAIASLADHPRVSVFDGDLDAALQACDYIVTQNSAVLLRGLFYRCPAVVFGDCEYHHPFQSVRLGVPVAEAFSRVMADPPDFAKYAYWYLQLNCINTSREWAEDTILSQCREFGWDI